MEGELQRVVGRRIREHRRRQGLSQEEFAEVLTVHRTYLGAVERGERNLTLRTVEHLAERLGVPALELLSEVPRQP